jgi:hypothetical protein
VVSPPIPFPGSRPPMVPTWIWVIQWGTAGGLGGWLGPEALSWLGWGMVATMTVVTLSLSEVLRWRQLARRDGSYSPRSLLAQVISLGVVGGLFLSVPAWLVALVLGDLVGRVPEVGAQAWSRCLVGACAGASVFALGWVLQQRRAAELTAG